MIVRLRCLVFIFIMSGCLADKLMIGFSFSSALLKNAHRNVTFLNIFYLFMYLHSKLLCFQNQTFIELTLALLIIIEMSNIFWQCTKINEQKLHLGGTSFSKSTGKYIILYCDVMVFNEPDIPRRRVALKP